jgi:hypothetical protein
MINIVFMAIGEKTANSPSTVQIATSPTCPRRKAVAIKAEGETPGTDFIFKIPKRVAPRFTLAST